MSSPHDTSTHLTRAIFFGAAGCAASLVGVFLLGPIVWVEAVVGPVAAAALSTCIWPLIVNTHSGRLWPSAFAGLIIGAFSLSCAGIVGGLADYYRMDGGELALAHIAFRHWYGFLLGSIWILPLSVCSGVVFGRLTKRTS